MTDPRNPEHRQQSGATSDREPGAGRASAESRGSGTDPFLRKSFIAAATFVLASLATALFVLGIEILLAAFAGILLAVLLRAATDTLTRWTPLSDGWALTVVILTITALLGLAGWLLAPSVIEQFDQLRERIPVLLAEIERVLQRHGWGRWLLEGTQAGTGIENVREDVGDVLAAFVRWSSYLLTAVMVGLFGAATPRLYRDAMVHLFPLHQRERVRDLLAEIAHTLRRWLIGQGLAMVIIGVSTMIVLGLLGLPLALALGLIVGLLGFIPYLGPILGAVPVAAVAAIEGSTMLLYAMLAYTAVQLLEGYVATPLIQRRMVYLPPAITVAIQIVFGVALGILGFVLATPIAAVGLVLVRFYRREILGDPEAERTAQTS